MRMLYIKVVDYNEQDGSLIIKCASDTTQSQNPDDYSGLAYQPAKMYPDITDPNEVMKRLAIASVHIAEMQTREEQFKQDVDKVNIYKNMVGTTEEYNLETDPVFTPILNAIIPT
jgi:hypothetical protein